METENISEKILKKTLEKAEVQDDSKADQKIDNERRLIKNYLSQNQSPEQRKQKQEALKKAIKETVLEYQKTYPNLTETQVRIWIFSEQITQNLAALKTGEKFKAHRSLTETDWKKIQETLVMFGYDLGEFGERKDGIDGKEGTMTQEAVKKLQKKLVKAGCFSDMEKPQAGVFEDGFCGDKTLLALERFLAQTKRPLIQTKKKVLNINPEEIPVFQVARDGDPLNGMDQIKSAEPVAQKERISEIAPALVISGGGAIALKQAREEALKLDQANKRLKNLVEATQKTEALLRKEIQSNGAQEKVLTKKLQQLKTDLAGQIQETEQLKSKNSHLQKSLKQAKASIFEVEATLENQRIKWQEEVQRLSRDVTQEQARVKVSEEKLKRVQEQLAIERKHNSVLQEEIKRGNGNKTALQKQLKISDEKIFEQQRALKTMQQSIAREKQAKTQAQEAFKQLQQSTEKVQTELRLTKNKLKTTREALATERRLVEKAKTELLKEKQRGKRLAEKQKLLELEKQKLQEQLKINERILKEAKQEKTTKQIKKYQKEITKSRRVLSSLDQKTFQTKAMTSEKVNTPLEKAKGVFSEAEIRYLKEIGVNPETRVQLEKIGKASPELMESLQQSLKNPKERALLKEDPKKLEVITKAEKYAQYQKSITKIAKYGGLFYACHVIYGYHHAPDNQKYDFLAKTTAEFGGFVAGAKMMETVVGSRMAHPACRLAVDLLGGMAGALGAAEAYEEYGKPALDKYFPNRNQNMEGWNNGRRALDMLTFSTGGAAMGAMDFALEKTKIKGAFAEDEDPLDYLGKTVTLGANKNLQEGLVQAYLVRDLDRLTQESHQTLRRLKQQKAEIEAMEKVSALRFPKDVRPLYLSTIKPLIQKDKQSKSWFGRLNYSVPQALQEKAKTTVLETMEKKIQRLESIQNGRWIEKKEQALNKTFVALGVMEKAFEMKIKEDDRGFVDKILTRIEKRTPLVSTSAENELWQKLQKETVQMGTETVKFSDFLSLYAINHKQQKQIQQIKEHGNLRGNRL